MTRSAKDWYPTRLLCKRFNVQPPAHVQPGSTEHGDEKSGDRNRPDDLVGKSTIDNMMKEANWGAMGAGRYPEPSEDLGEAEKVKTEEDVKPVLVDSERNEALEGKRAGDAVFKAIFGDDSDDDD